MPNNILITPGSASIQFSGSAANTIRLQVEQSGSIAFYGNAGSLFGITDQLSGSLMSVNDISGLPILEVFSDDRVVMGTYNQNTLVVTGSRVGIGTAIPTAKLQVQGDISASAYTSSINNAVGFFGTASYAVNAGSGTSGTSGTTGTSGTAGSSGTSGTAGSSGTSGTAGSSGTSGTAGSSGTSGTTGTSGTRGTSGTTGTSGTSGTTGTSGTSGANGAAGTSGTSGTAGAAGTSGTSGTAGSSGTTGTSGTRGTSGTSGANGSSGTSGTAGSSGTSGAGTISGGAANKVAYFSGTTTLTSTTNFHFNGTNLGIGTTTPTGSLQVNKASQSSGSTVPSGAFILSNTAAGNGVLEMGTDANAIGWIQSRNITTLTLYSLALQPHGGNVGIGIGTPAYPLQVRRASGAASLGINLDNVGGVAALARSVLYYAIGDTTSDNTGHVFYTRNGTATDNIRMVINASGSVGIGESSPSGILQVGAMTGITAPWIYFNNNVGTTPNPVGFVGLAMGWNPSNGGGESIIAYGSGSGGLNLGGSRRLSLAEWNGTTLTEVLTLQNRNVGIGTTSPETTLHVNGQLTLKSSGEGGPYIYRDGSNAGDIRFYSTNGTFASPTAKVAEGLLGQIHYAGYTGTAYKTAAQIWAVVDGAVTSTVVPGRIDFKTSNSSSDPTTRMTIKSDGNVGIGTTSPANLFHVNGSNYFARISNTGVGDGGLKISYQNSDTHGLHLTYNPQSAVSYIDNTYPTASGQVYGDIYFRQNVGGTMTTRMTIKADGGGNVGIGTTSPAARLHVQAASTNDIIRLTRTTDSAGSGFIFANSNEMFGVHDGTNYPFLVKQGATTNTLVVSGGNVGIGTTSTHDGAKLDVRSGKIVAGSGGGSTNGSVTIQDYYSDGALAVWGAMLSSGGPFMGYAVRSSPSGVNAFVSATGINVARGAYIIEGDIHRWYNGGAQVVTAGSSVTTTERMVLNANGSVGIGTTSPLSRLHVQAASGTYTSPENNAVAGIYVYNSTSNSTTAHAFIALRTNGNNGGDPFISFDVNGITGWSIGQDNSDSDRLIIASRWDGVSSGNNQLRLDNAGTLTVAGDVVAYGSPSDITFKTNIQPVTGALEKVVQLRGVTFDWKEDTDVAMTNVKEDIGFIAQEVQEVLPTIVRQNPNGKLSLRDRALVPLLVEAIKEQQQIIKKLEARIETLETF